jgi:ERCC4-type nuclease
LILRLDCRECEIIKEFEKEQELNYNVEKLEIGDVIIETEQNLLIIERKTCSDLISSILDGRFREQKKRLLLFKEECQKNCIVVFLIEQNNYPIKFKKHLLSSIIHLNFLYDFKVIYSKNTFDSVEILKHLINEKFIDEEIKKKTTNDENITCLKKYKKHCGYSNFVKMLNCIDGISVNTAVAIENNGIDNISKLIDILQNYPFKLENIQTNKRKISKNLIEKLKIGLNL